ncbi:cobalamin biosynthesis protein [Paraburkholderia phytofirmans]|uniref:Cobalamin biosynthesis protein CbiG n=1 Tax=Paraburkholderia phytofirmans (strain DSM 17436 / LMG 22146 / PsJN) TaxID=398527 RepID=B2TCD8_PARPJ|nr:cobalamin biosynthesis protein [Paraburkholderia phytofirmans]ACD19362.1 cobalamin biosynthesis protein CbiG [Paraburkholderia phytofirmans PsJN]
MKTLSVGIGCRLHSPAEQIEAAVRAALGAHSFDEIRTVASLDSKAREAGLLEFCARHALPLTFFSLEQIAAMPVAVPSASAREHLGVDGVCEPCALLGAAADAGGGAGLSESVIGNAPRATLLVRKTVYAGVTVAIASTTAQAAQSAQAEHPDNDTQKQDLP